MANQPPNSQTSQQAPKPEFGNGLYVGMVRHFRFKPLRHKLAYRVYSMLIDVDQIDAIDQQLRWFSRGRFRKTPRAVWRIETRARSGQNERS